MQKSIRLAELKDIPKLVEICSFVQKQHVNRRPDIYKWPFDWEEISSFYRKILEGDRNVHSILVVEDPQAEVVGYLFYEIIRKTPSAYKHATAILYIHQIGCLPDIRGRGYGQELMHAAVAAAQDARVTEIQLDYMASNENAESFYEKFGFLPLMKKVTLDLT